MRFLSPPKTGFLSRRAQNGGRFGMRFLSPSKTGFLSRAGTFWWQKVLPKPSACRLARDSPGPRAEQVKEDQAFPSSCSERSEPRQIYFRATRKCGGDFYAQKQETEQVKVKRCKGVVKGIPALRKTRSRKSAYRNASAGDGLLANPRSRPAPWRDVPFPCFSHAGRFLRRFLPIQKAA